MKKADAIEAYCTAVTTLRGLTDAFEIKEAKQAVAAAEKMLDGSMLGQALSFWLRVACL